LRRLACVLTAALVVAGIAGIAAARSNGSVPRVGSTGFVRTITNPYLPYRPGSVWVYKGVKDGASQTDVVRVTHRTRIIAGVRCTSITDVATHGTRVLERTTDWYAQDSAGNVWYFGENTAAYGPGGQVDRSGSWLAGLHGARSTGPGTPRTSTGWWRSGSACASRWPRTPTPPGRSNGHGSSRA
jgi:hypothetical protein